MIKIHSTLLIALLALGLTSARANKPDYNRLSERVNKASIILQELRSEKGIPQETIAKAKGIAILRITKGGLVVSGSDGHGIVVARTATGWSAPLAFSAGGAGIGLQVGGEKSDLVFVLNSQEAIDEFMRGDAFKLSGTAGVTAGDSSVHESASITGSKGTFVYRRTNGAFAGAAFQGADVSLDNETNRKAYGEGYSPADVLGGKVHPPAVAKPLYRALGGGVK
jgi:SH3 domain-containing YSC84-like protein 1